MIQLGDVVFRNEFFARTAGLTASYENHNWGSPGIVTGISGDLYNVLHLKANGTTEANQWHNSYLEIKHPLESMEAADFYQRLGAQAPHNYSWYLAQRGLVAPTRPTVPPTELVQGQRYIRTVAGYWDEPDHVPVGAEVTYVGDHFGTEYYHGIRLQTASVRVDGAYRSWWVPADCLSLLPAGAQPRPTPTPTIANPPATWQLYDVVERIGGANYLNEVAIGTQVYVKVPGCVFFDGWVSGITGSTFHHSTADYKWVRRPSPNEMPLAYPFWVNMEGTTSEQRRDFEDELNKRGMQCYSRNRGSVYTTYENRENNADHYLAVGYSVNEWLYHTSAISRSSPRVNLLEGWNRALLSVEERNKVKAAKKTTKEPEAEKPKDYLYSVLPPVLVVASGRESFDASMQKALLSKLRIPHTEGISGHYLLFHHNHVSATSVPGVAQAFQDKHNAPRLNTQADKKLLNTLYNQRISLLEKTMATEKQLEEKAFAVDVAASGAYLITAFKGFLSTIGYRQHNPDVTDGPYLLLNGGGLEANLPMSWQYSATKNNRRNLTSLATDGGWDYVTQRLASGNVALPIDEDELLVEDVPTAGCTAVVLDTAVQEGLPETALFLANFAPGKAYKVKRVDGTACMMDNGFLLSTSRLGIISSPGKLNNGDTVILKEDVGDSLKAGQIMSLATNATGYSLLDEQGTSYTVHSSAFERASTQNITGFLLRKAGITLPQRVLITNEDCFTVGQELTLTTAWPLTSQTLAYWTEEGTDQQSYFTRDDFALVQDATSASPENTTIRVLKGADENFLEINGQRFSTALVEGLLAEALT